MLQNINPKGAPIIYDDVPMQMKPPFNMQWKQIPFGFPFAGGYMYDSPFETGLPWEKLGKEPIPQIDIILGGPPKAGFVETHGPVPEDAGERRVWKDAHQWFVSAGLPAELQHPEIQAMLDASNSVAAEWKLSGGKVYVGRFGAMIRFPASLIRSFEVSLHTWIMIVHSAIASYQMDVWTYLGKIPDKWHPLVPPAFLENVKNGIR